MADKGATRLAARQGSAPVVEAGVDVGEAGEHLGGEDGKGDLPADEADSGPVEGGGLLGGGNPAGVDEGGGGLGQPGRVVDGKSAALGSGGGQVGADEGGGTGGGEVEQLLVGQGGAAAEQGEGGAGEGDGLQSGDAGILKQADAHP